MKLPAWLTEDVPAGTSRRRFHLPTHRHLNRMGYQTWIMPLAPFVIVGMAARNAFFAFWHDIVASISEWANPDVIERKCDYDFCTIHCHSADRRK